MNPPSDTRPSPTRSSLRPARGGRPALALLMLLAWLSVAAGPPVWRSNHVRPISLTQGQIREMTAIVQGPPTQSRAGVMMDVGSNAQLWQWNADTALPMASVTKLMTVLVALETLSPDDVITVPAEALAIPAGYVRMGLKAGQKVQVLTLLYGALLPSGNDAALALAIAAAGSEQAFVDKMNARAAEWGLSHTHFVNPHGIDAPEHYASARDLAQLAIRVLKNPLIAEIVAGISTSADYACCVDRREAICRAVREARRGDIVLVAGKGHESYQEIKGKKYPFDDVAEVRRAIAREEQGRDRSQ
jgi:D-alanyl-D-alanine carboxypeptidase